LVGTDGQIALRTIVGGPASRLLLSVFLSPVCHSLAAKKDAVLQA
jgi:hypothetical protein